MVTVSQITPIPISQLPAATTLTGNEATAIVQDGQTVQAPIASYPQGIVAGVVTFGNTGGAPFPHYRTLKAGEGIELTDAGSQADLTISLASGGNAAPATASYVVMNASTVLDHERILAVGSSLSLTDTGANGTATIGTQAISGAVTTAANSFVTVLTSGIDAVKIADGSVSSAEFQYLDGVTSNIQTQLNAKGVGTITAVSVASANGFAGNSSGGATPALTLSTSVTGIPVGNGTAFSASNLTNDVQTKAAIVPNTAPSAGQILVGNAGGTAYAPATVSGAITLSSAGAATIATPGTLAVASTNSTATAHTHAITSSSAPGASASLLATDSSGIIGTTGARIVKGWFSDITCTNAISGSITGNASTVTTNANSTGAITSIGNATLLGSFSSANLASALTDETGTGLSVFNTAPTINQANLVGTTTNDSAAAGSVGEFLTSNSGSATATVTITIASPAVITFTGHGIAGIIPVVFTTSSALPTGLTAGTVYWTIASTVTTNTFQVAASIANAVAGTSVNTSGSQSGTQTCTTGIPLTTITATSCGALSLTAGDWDVWGTVVYVPTGLATQYITAVNTGNNALTAPQYYNGITGVTFVSASFQAFQAPAQQIKLASTTTIYPIAYSSFSTGATVAIGSIFARRRR